MNLDGQLDRAVAPNRPPLALAGCDFRRASTAWRSALVLDAAGRADLRERLADSCGVVGLVALDTCGRTEWMVETSEPERAAAELDACLRRCWTGRDAPTPYVKFGRDAARHALRVAVGLESFVPGEREVASQFHGALARARSEGHASRALEVLGSAAGRAVRRVERATRFRDAGRGVHRLVLEHLERALPERTRGVGIVGMGEIGQRVAGLLTARGYDVLLFNRTVPRERRDHWRPIESLPAHVEHLEALVVTTGAQSPTVHLDDLSATRHLALVLDLGVPPQVTGALPNGDVNGLDDLLRISLAQPPAEDQERATRVVEDCLTELELAIASSPTGLARRTRPALPAASPCLPNVPPSS